LQVWRSSSPHPPSPPHARSYCFSLETRAALVACLACERAAHPPASAFCWRDAACALAPDFCRAFPDVCDVSRAIHWASSDGTPAAGLKRARAGCSPRAPCVCSPFAVDPSWSPSADISGMSLRELENEHMHLLVRDLKLGKVVLFTGAGLFQAAGLPNWRDLLLLLIDKYQEDRADAGSADDAARTAQLVDRLRKFVDEDRHEQVAQASCRTQHTHVPAALPADAARRSWKTRHGAESIF
jgi:hypothetical protein